MNNSISQIITNRGTVWYHQSDGFYYTKVRIRCGKTILKCVERMCKVRAVINNDKIISLNQHVHKHDFSLKKRLDAQLKESGPRTSAPRRKKLKEIEIESKGQLPIEEFITERRGTWYHQRDGYYYRKYQVHPPKIYVECIEQKCNVTAVMNENLRGCIYIVSDRTHNHPADILKLEVMSVRKKILRRCKNEDTLLQTIFIEETEKIDGDVRKRIQFSTFKNAMAKNRQLRNSDLPASLSAYALLLQSRPENLTLCGEPFFNFHTDDFAIFISPTVRNLMYHSSIFSIDRIKNVPRRPCKHFFTLGAVLDEVLFPVIYVMMAEQNCDIYKNVFEYLKKEFHLWNPKTIICDFEKGLNEVIMLMFPNVVVTCSWLYFCNTIMQKLKKSPSMELIENYANSKQRETVEMLMALPLLPCNLIREGLKAIEDDASPDMKNFKQLFTYIRNYWLLRESMNMFLLSKTILDISYCHEELRDTFAPHLANYETSHPNIWEFTDILRHIEHDFALRYRSKNENSDCDQISGSVQLQYRDLITNAKNQLNEGQLSIIEFLKEIHHLVPSITEFSSNMKSEVNVVLVGLEDDTSPEIEEELFTEEIEITCNWNEEEEET